MSQSDWMFSIYVRNFYVLTRMEAKRYDSCCKVAIKNEKEIYRKILSQTQQRTGSEDNGANIKEITIA